VGEGGSGEQWNLRVGPAIIDDFKTKITENRKGVAIGCAHFYFTYFYVLFFNFLMYF